MILDEECPVDVVGEALRLASQIEIGDIPLDFDAADLPWREILAEIARQFSNHQVLLHQLDGFLEEVRTEHSPDCDLMDGSESDPCEACTERWLAEHQLWEATLEAAERAYQRWLARQALRRATNRNA